MSMTCGIDWAEADHDVALVDADGTLVARQRITADLAGFTTLIQLVTEHGGSARDVPVAIETEKDLLVVALAAAGFTVYPINPRAVARYRERHAQAGAKSDPGDARVLANVLRTDQRNHRPLPAVSDAGLAVKALARQHQEAIWALQQTASRLRAVLLEFYPQALQAFPKLTHYAATTILLAAPTPTSAAKLTPDRVETLLRRCGRRNDAGLAERIARQLRTPRLRQPAAVEKALGVTVTGLLRLTEAVRATVEEHETALAEAFAAHPLAKILTSAPGLGRVLASRVLAEIGDDSTRFTTANGLRAFAGTAPVTRASGRSHYVKARKIRNKRLGDACHWWAFAALTWSPGARAHYDRRRAVGDHHNAALRNVANKLIGRLWWCIVNDRQWDEQAAWPAPGRTPQTAAA